MFLERSTELRDARFSTFLGQAVLFPWNNMSGFMKTVLKTESGVFWFFCFFSFLCWFFSAFAMTEACKSYLARNVETTCRMFHLFRFFFLIIYRPPPSPFLIWVKFSPGYTRLNSVRAVTLTRSDRLAFCICCLKEVCPRTSLSPMKVQV